MTQAANLINKILFYGILFLGIFVFLFDFNNVSRLLMLACSFIASAVFSWILKKRGIYGKGLILVLINIFLWLNILGEMGLFYSNSIAYYDKILHFSTGILITAIAYLDLSKNLKPRKEIAFLIAVGLFCLWEIGEYLLFAFFGFPVVGVIIDGNVIVPYYEDTMFDLICGSIGALLYLFFIGERERARKK